MGIATSITLTVILEIMAERPDLSLELVAGQDPIDYEGVNGQLHNVKDYFSSNGISCKLKGVSPKYEAGVTCLLHLDGDMALVSYFKNRKIQNIAPSIYLESDDENDVSPREEALRNTVEKLEEWCETCMHVKRH